jgi:predicted GIY-YIG superfamily endonuclease
MKWTYEKCKQEALKYNTRKELRQNNTALASKIFREKWYELFNHMEHVGNKYNRLIYVYEFPDNHCYVGLTFNINERNRKHLSSEKSFVFIHRKETGLEPKLVIKTDYINVEEASIMESIIENEYKNNGWTILNKAKTGGIGGGKIKWTYQKCKEEITKYNNMTDVCVKSKGLYYALKTNGWVEELCSHIDRSKTRGLWNNKEKCYNEAIKYKNISEFRLNCWAGYNYSKINGWLNEFFNKKAVV